MFDVFEPARRLGALEAVEKTAFATLAASPKTSSARLPRRRPRRAPIPEAPPQHGRTSPRTRRRPSPRPARRPASSKRAGLVSGVRAPTPLLPRGTGDVESARPSSNEKSASVRRSTRASQRRREGSPSAARAGPHRNAGGSGATFPASRSRLERARGIPRHLCPPADRLLDGVAGVRGASPGRRARLAHRAGGTPPRAPLVLLVPALASAGVAASETCTRTQNSRKLSGSSSRAGPRPRPRRAPHDHAAAFMEAAAGRAVEAAPARRAVAVAREIRMTEMVRIAVVAIVTRRGPLALRADFCPGRPARVPRRGKGGSSKRCGGGTNARRSLAPGGRRVEVRIVIHLGGKRPSADSGGEGGRGGRARWRARRRPSARASPSDRDRSRGASRKEAGLEPSGGACLCPRFPPPPRSILQRGNEAGAAQPARAMARRRRPDRISAPRFHSIVIFRALCKIRDSISKSRLQTVADRICPIIGHRLGLDPLEPKISCLVAVGISRFEALEHSTVIGKSEKSQHDRHPPRHSFPHTLHHHDLRRRSAP